MISPPQGRDGGLTQALDPVLGLIRFPAEPLPMAIIRSLSGSATLAVDTINQHGEDSIFVMSAAMMYGLARPPST